MYQIQINDSFQVVKMLAASMLVELEGQKYLVTRKVFNQIIDKTVDQIPLFVVEKEYRGIVSKWIAIPSIF